MWRSAFATLLAGALLTLGGAGWIEARNEARVNEALGRDLSSLAHVIVERVTLYSYGLRGMRGAVLTAGDDQVTAQTIRQYSRTRDLEAEFPGSRGFGFIRRVPVENEARFVELARKDGRPGFAIRQLTPHSGERFIIQYIEPEGPNAAAVGLDIASEFNRREAALAAIDTGTAQLTAPITLVQASGDKLQSFLLLLPIYRGYDTPQTLEERRQAALGWSYTPLNMKQVLAHIAPDPRLLELDLRDVHAAADPFFATSDTQAGERVTQTLEQVVHGRTWRIKISGTPAYVQAMNLTPASSVVAIGVALSTLAAIFAAVLAQSRARRRQVQRTQTQLATIIANTADAVIGEALDGSITSWNRGAENLFGHKAADVIGKPLAPLLLSAERWGEDTSIIARAAAGEAIAAFDTRRLRIDGTAVDVSLTACPIHNDAGKVIGVAKLMQDVSERVAAQRRLQDMHSKLERDVEARTVELGTTRRTLQMVLDSVPSMIGYWDGGLRCRMVNRAFADWLGTQPATLIGQTIQAAWGHDWFAQSDVHIEAALRGEAQAFEQPVSGRGGIRHFWINYVPDILDGIVQGFYVVAHDITEMVEGRHRLTAALLENQALLRTIDEQLACSSTDRAGRILTVNDNFCAMLGYSREELVGKTHRVVNSGVHAKAFWKEMWDTISAGKAWRGEVCNRNKDGSLRWLDSVFTPLISEDGTVERYLALRIDITDRKRVETERNRINALLRGVLGSATEFSIIATDPDGLITIFNSGAERMLGYAADELIGRQTPALIHDAAEVEQRGRELSEEFGATIEGFRVFVHKPEIDGVEARDWTYIRRDGSRLTVTLVVTAIRADDGVITGYLGVAQDVTRRNETERQMRLAKDAAEAASLAKGQFLANMSHEIRTPMNAVLGMLTLIQRTELDQRQKDYVAKAHMAATSLLGLLNDILDLSKIEAGKLELDPHPFDLDAVMGELAVVLAAGNQGKDVEVLFDIPPDLPAAFHGDSLRLRQILLNLAGNALKFTEHGQVIVSVRTMAATSSDVTLRFMVSDTGIGIAPDKQQQIFGAFQQAESSTTRRFGGTGLGLAITRRLVELMGGTIQLQSTVGRGSQFWFDICLPIAEPASTRDVLPAGLNVLVVDDDVLAGELLVDLLVGLGQRATSVAGGPQALHQIVQAAEAGKPFDAVFLDWRMGGMDGLATARCIRSVVEKCPAIIMVTAHERDMLVDAARDTPPPFDALLTKPVTSGRLIRSLRETLHMQGAAPELQMGEACPLTGRRLLVVEDNPVNRQVASELLSGLGAVVELADGGVPGVRRVLEGAATFDAVLMDIQMPDIDGYEATRRIRDDGRFANLPIIAMTAHASQSDRQACLDAGMDDHVTKPIDVQAILAALQKCCDARTDSRQYLSIGDILLSGGDETPLVESKERVSQRLAGRLDVLGNLLPLFEQQTKVALVEVGEAITHRDADRLSTLFHTLKGSAGSVGALALAQAAAAWEQQLRADEVEALACLEQDHDLLPRLEDMLRRSVAALTSHMLVSTVAGECTGTQGGGDWRMSVSTLTSLLEAGNMQALDDVAKVQQMLPPDRTEQFAPILAQVRAFDFRGAAAGLRTMAGSN